MSIYLNELNIVISLVIWVHEKPSDQWSNLLGIGISSMYINVLSPLLSTYYVYMILFMTKLQEMKVHWITVFCSFFLTSGQHFYVIGQGFWERREYNFSSLQESLWDRQLSIDIHHPTSIGVLRHSKTTSHWSDSA